MDLRSRWSRIGEKRKVRYLLTERLSELVEYRDGNGRKGSARILALTQTTMSCHFIPPGTRDHIIDLLSRIAEGKGSEHEGALMIQILT